MVENSNEIVLWNYGHGNRSPLLLNLRTGAYRRRICLRSSSKINGWYKKIHGHYLMVYRDGDQLYLRIDSDIYPLESVGVKWETHGKKIYTREEYDGQVTYRDKSHVQILVNGQEIYYLQYKTVSPGLLNWCDPDFDPVMEDFFLALYKKMKVSYSSWFV